MQKVRAVTFQQTAQQKGFTPAKRRTSESAKAHRKPMKKDRKTGPKKSKELTPVEEVVVAPEMAAETPTLQETSVDDLATTPVVADFDPYDTEAWAWMSSEESIPGAFSPILYIGQSVSVGVSKMLGRSMTLAEAQHLVKPDGEMVTCTAKGIRFQPVMYLPFPPKDLEEQLKGKKLTEITLPYGGAFYVDRDQRPYGFSGSVYNPDYEYCKSSALIMAAQEKGKLMRRKLQWGYPLAVAGRVQQARRENNELRQKIAGLMVNLNVPSRRNFAQMDDAFTQARELETNGEGRRSYHHKRHNRRERVVEE